MGDRITDRSLAADRRQGPVHPGTGGSCSLSGGLDFAVHSSKDMPTKLPRRPVPLGLPAARGRSRRLRRPHRRKALDLPQRRHHRLLVAAPPGADQAAAAGYQRHHLSRPRRYAAAQAGGRPGRCDAARLRRPEAARQGRRADRNPRSRKSFRRRRRRARSASKAASATTGSTTCWKPSTTRGPMRPSPANGQFPLDARRLLPHADRRLCGLERRHDPLLRHDPDAGRQPASPGNDRRQARPTPSRSRRQGRRRYPRRGRTGFLLELDLSHARPCHPAATLSGGNGGKA